MTDDRLPLADLLAKAGDSDLLRSVAEMAGLRHGYEGWLSLELGL
ncbi:MAG: hypothetical protein ACK53U_14085 [Alphaproteobacteria bacterium]